MEEEHFGPDPGLSLVNQGTRSRLSSAPDIKSANAANISLQYFYAYYTHLSYRTLRKWRPHFRLTLEFY
jgi:hypothetical protein